jgi:hypothetical protein
MKKLIAGSIVIKNKEEKLINIFYDDIEVSESYVE